MAHCWRGKRAVKREGVKGGWVMPAYIDLVTKKYTAILYHKVDMGREREREKVVQLSGWLTKGSI